MADKEYNVDASASQPLPISLEQKRNSNRSKDSEKVVDELNKIIRMKKQMKKNKLEVKDKIEKVREKSPVALFSANKAYLDLKAQFTAQLPKLNTLDTRQSALKELEAIIEQNKTSEGLRVYLSSLSEYKKPQNFSTNESEVFLLGLICDLYGANLIDILDNPPSLLNTCMRIGELISRYFKDQNENVQRQCCKTWKQMYRSQLLNAPLKQKLMVLYEIPASIIQGGKDRVAQITAIMTIESILDFAEKVSDKELVMGIAKKYLPCIYFKFFLDTPSLVVCARLIVSTVLIKNLQIYMAQILEKTLQFLLPQENRPIQYKIKIEACEFLTVLARQLQEVATQIIGQYQDEIIPVLQEISKDRLLKVQSSAKQALKEWQLLKQKVEDLEKKKLTKKQKTRKDYLDPDEIINQKTGDVVDQIAQLKKRPQNQTRTIILENENGIKNVLSKQQGWVNELKAKNFMRKQTGVGGGRTVLNEDKLKISKSQLNQQQKLREYILGQYKELRQDMKNKKMEQEQQQDIIIYQKQNKNIDNIIQDYENQPYFTQNKMIINNKSSAIDNFSNNFYSSQLQNLQNIQKTQQQLIEDQLKLYPHNESNEDRKFIVPPQTVYPYQNMLSSGAADMLYTKQKYQEAQPEFLTLEENQFKQEIQQSQENQLKNERPIQNLQVQDKNIYTQNVDILEETQDFNNENFLASKQAQNQLLNIKNLPISEVWDKAIQLIDQDDVDHAFQIILDSEDDLYFIRLLMRIGMQIEKLKRHTAVRAIQRYLMIQKSNFVNRLCFDFYHDSLNSGLQDHLTIEDQREVQEVVEELTHSSNNQTKSIAQNFQSTLYQNIPQ
ncbi:hypothetical protein TTHERM_00141080 (macronuclear) [Tetrahymena thermophila SB210]|uniref:Armadillo-type fold n=1 Tax=Tetrahymena thermophila (strain SB210) TaxID=312017 RepID=I7LU85_TETTS|nr:hypothetical protein TTHERM_00141080 [Tetrahymena thermophila SB210]EAR90800.2 hypothetical protein TTHERM_00141080 [Tetrahymena thermophila SB210]|eukprot:XP_001011045.2 hypothetical protein TTHERM_00141080 [Tetrahymena thermophila SB210]